VFAGNVKASLGFSSASQRVRVIATFSHEFWEQLAAPSARFDVLK
jgi:hypothetical protein